MGITTGKDNETADLYEQEDMDSYFQSMYILLPSWMVSYDFFKGLENLSYC